MTEPWQTRTTLKKLESALGHPATIPSFQERPYLCAKPTFGLLPRGAKIETSQAFLRPWTALARAS
jgi:hypothetical protein